jgi:nucleoredoxin
MLRSGYSSEAVVRELSHRRFADPFDSQMESDLKKTGASAALLDVLRAGTYQVSPQEAAALAEKRIAQEEAAQPESTRDPRAPSKSHTSAKTTAAAPINQVYRLLQDDLVALHDGVVVPFNDETFRDKKLYLFFFSANGSPMGRKFTPQLVEYYNRVVPQHPEFEVVFFSADRSQFGMETYMTQSRMPWPAVTFSKIGAKAAGMEQSVIKEIPCLVLVDAEGTVLSKTGGSGDDAPKVLAALDKIFAQRSDPALARAH